MSSEAARTETLEPLLTTDESAFGVRGVGVVVDPERAAELGAFREDALSLEDVLAAQEEE